ncbi:PIG-X [Amylocarpus encephaloides]|uniref:Protein PBN1 n=1 Tax=Amylocarpus encephaloides TaxID=45428 RepID=A0A9P7YK17_9HELO|nr:PIG-X [Amylocarpus encephaloides]
MRQRITFIQESEDSFDPKLLDVYISSIKARGIRAIREDRITFGLQELPQELYRVLKASHELHIRWVGTRSYMSVPPIVSRLSPGLHVFYTPQRNSSNSDLLCPSLKKILGDIDCESTEASFTNLPAERFSLSAAKQYYSPLFDLDELQTYLLHKLCKDAHPNCLQRIELLETAASLDIDFDTISHALTITAFWPKRSWDFDMSNMEPKERLEVGILTESHAQEPEELSLGGFLTVVSEDTKPSPTLFSFPSRHHPYDGSFTSSFIQPTGLHPVLKLDISYRAPPFPKEDRSCSLHAHLTLPRAIFADKYQLADSLFLASKNLVALHYITTPVDLEAPAYTLPIWGSSLLLELAPSQASNLVPPETSEWDTSFTAHIPLHLRYLPPSVTPQTLLSVPSPVLFWACTADEGSKFPVNPFDRTNLGYDGLFGPRTMFYHLDPKPSIEGEGLLNEISVPVLDLEGSKWVETGTAGVMMLGFAWVCWCLLSVWMKNGYGATKAINRGKKEQ